MKGTMAVRMKVSDVEVLNKRYPKKKRELSADYFHRVFNHLFN